MAKAKAKTKSANGSGYIKVEKKTGYVFGVISWLENGKRKTQSQRAISGTKTEAREHIRTMLSERAAKLAGAIDGSRLTLGQLAEFHIETNLIDAHFNDDGKRTRGVFSWADKRRKVREIVAYFGPELLIGKRPGKPCGDLTLGMIRDFKNHLATVPVVSRWISNKKEIKKDPKTKPIYGVTPLYNPKTGQPKMPTVATVHRKIAELRRMLNVAMEHEWIAKNPAGGRVGLIKPGEETKRTTIASQTAELAMLAQCETDDKRTHLGPYLLTSFDHGCRSIELRRMLVRDVNFNAIVEGEKVTTFAVHSFKGTRRIDREYVATPRVAEALRDCCKGKTPDQHIFTWTTGKKGEKVHVPMKAAPKRSFDTIKRLVYEKKGIDLSGFRKHDIRHTQITRLVESGMTVDEACSLAGHTQPSTTWRYLNPGQRSQKRAANMIANYSEASVVQFKKPKRKKAAA